ncbi:MAG: thioredoxin family protein [Sporocytophaga sp.]|nr:thioredoxin family protein [Sporocytophaga sp.]
MAVIAVEDSNFDAELAKNPNVIVKFYADWCGSCKLFAPKYKRLSNDERFPGIVFLEVNAENNPEARKKANVNNLPTFATFQNGVLVETLCSSKEEAVVEALEKLK